MNMKKCEICRCNFDPINERPSHRARFCSRRCAGLSQRNRIILQCRNCEHTFERKAYMKNWSQERGPFCGFPCYAIWQSRNTCGLNNPNYQTAAHLEVVCDYCEKKFYRSRSYRGGERQFCSRKCFHDFARINWIKALPRGYGKSWASARKYTLERDGHRCQDCGIDRPLVVHHRQPYLTYASSLDAHALDNLVTLCRGCHLVRHNPLASPNMGERLRNN